MKRSPGSANQLRRGKHAAHRLLLGAPCALVAILVGDAAISGGMPIGKRFFTFESQRVLGPAVTSPRPLTQAQFRLLTNLAYSDSRFLPFDFFVYEGNAMRRPGIYFPPLEEYFDHPILESYRTDIDIRLSLRHPATLARKERFLAAAREAVRPLSREFGRPININPRRPWSLGTMRYYLYEKHFFSPEVTGDYAQHLAWLDFLRDYPQALNDTVNRCKWKERFLMEYIGRAAPSSARFQYLPDHRIPRDIMNELWDRSYLNVWRGDERLLFGTPSTAVRPLSRGLRLFVGHLATDDGYQMTRPASPPGSFKARISGTYSGTPSRCFQCGLGR